MEKIRLTCPCLFGVESVLAFEVKRLGVEDVEVADGRVSFTGTPEDIVRANIRLRCAERVQILLASFEARSFEELFQGVLAAELERYIGVTDAFPVKGYSLNSQLHSVPDCQKIIKKAAVKRLERCYHQSWFEECGAVKQLQFSIYKDRVLLMLDTSGAGLHKRGYRPNANAAPIRETLAAAIADLAHVRSDSLVVDPFCGSGTLMIESALRAMNIAPGLRRKFAFEGWNWRELDGGFAADYRRECVAQIDHEAGFSAKGFDIDPDMRRLTATNARNAGVGPRISAEVADVRDFDAAKLLPEGGTVLCNPPYGERMLDIREAEKLYREMGRVFVPDENIGYYIITPDEDFEQIFGRKADKRRKLYNGMIRCTLYMYFPQKVKRYK